MELTKEKIVDLAILVSFFSSCYCILLTNGEPSICPSPNSTSLVMDPAQDNYTLNQLVSLSCAQTNLTLIGPPQVTCTVGGQWDSKLPICIEMVCAPPEMPRFGLAELEYFNDTDIRVAFSCLYRYTLVGVSQVACDQKTGAWSDLAPHCYASCGEPPGVSFGQWQVACMHENCTARYSCDTGYEVKGSGQVTCMDSGLWSELTTYCQAPTTTTVSTTPTTTTQHPMEHESTTTSAVMSSTPTSTTDGPIPCSEPPALKFGSYRRYSRFIIYRCHHGYILRGNDERHCYDNGSWSGALPTCVAVASSPASKKPYHWKQVFIDHGKWQGHYEYQGQRVTFTFTVQSVQLDPPPAVMGLFREGTIKFQLKGSEEKSGEIVFRMMKLFVATERFPTIDWATRGWLQEHPCSWTYTGSIETPLQGFQTFHMEAKRFDRLKSEECKSSGSKSTEYIIVGVFLSILVVCVPLVALLWIRRDRLIQGRGHRTLTSFENPVYEYENGLK